MKDYLHLFTLVSEFVINCYKTGNWDGEKSDPMIVLTKSGAIYEVFAYETIYAGEKCIDYYDYLDCEIVHITHVLDLSKLTTKAEYEAKVRQCEEKIGLDHDVIKDLAGQVDRLTKELEDYKNGYNAQDAFKDMQS